MTRRELHDRHGGLDALGDHLHLGQDLVERTAPPELLADVPIPALRADARRDEVAHAGEACERGGLTAHGHAEARQFGKAARDHRCPRVVAHADALGDAGGDGDDVLERPAHFAADDVVVHVDAEQSTAQHLLERGRDRQVLGGDNTRGRVPGHDLLGQVWARQRGGGMPREQFLDDLGHAQERALLESLGEAHDRDPWAHVRSRLFEHAAEAV